MRWGTLCLLAVVAGGANAASPTWLRVSSPSIEIFTDSGEATARAILKRFETLHRIFNDAYTADSPAPLRVFIFSSPREYQKYRANPASDDFYIADGDREFIVLEERASLRRAATHEYLHMVMHHASPLLPHWLSEGVAEFYSTVSVNGTKVHTGDPIDADLALLKREPWLSAEDLALDQHRDSHMFYAESWALVHMLSLSPASRGGMPQFVKLLSDGREQGEAFTSAFRKPMAVALAELRRYLFHLEEATVPAPPMEAPEKYQVTPLTRYDVTLALADLALLTEHSELAKSLFLEAAKINPETPQAAAALGSLALIELRKADAQREFERAIAMGDRDVSTYLELAILKNDDALLEKALTIDPNLSDAHFLLGVRATDRGNLIAAVEHLRHAVAIQPRRFTYWHALGYAQAKAGDRQGAAESARRTAILASNAEEEQMAAALTLLASDVPAVRVKKPDVVTPGSWQNRTGDARAEGTLIRVACDSSPVKLVVSASGESLEFEVQNPTEVELLNADGVSTTLVCGEQTRPVAVDYVAATRAITRIEFKQVIMKR